MYHEDSIPGMTKTNGRKDKDNSSQERKITVLLHKGKRIAIIIDHEDIETRN